MHLLNPLTTVDISHVLYELTFEEHSVDDHRPVCLLHVLGDLGQFTVRGLDRPSVDGLHGALLVLEVDLGVLAVVVLLARLQEALGEGDGAGPVHAAADLPGDVAGGGVAHLAQQLRQARVQLLVLQRVGLQQALHLGGGGGLAPQGHQAQGGGHHHRGDQDVLHVLLLGHALVQAEGQAGAVVSQQGGVGAEDLIRGGRRGRGCCVGQQG